MKKNKKNKNIKREIPSKFYKNQSIDLADYLIEHFNDIPDRVYFLLFLHCLESLLKNLIVNEVYKKFSGEGNNNENYQKFTKQAKEEMLKRGHKIDELLNLDKDLKDKLSIKSIVKNRGEFVNQFQVNFNDNKFLIIPTLEALRYGVFSKKRNTLLGLCCKEKACLIIENIRNYIKKNIIY